MPDILTNGTHVTLTTPLPGHPAGSTGTVHGSWASHTGVIFDTTPGYIRYVPPTYLTAHNDVADVTKAAENAVLHIIETAMNMDTPCNWPNCDGLAVWWWEHTCGRIIYRCEPHRAQQDHRMERYEAKHPNRGWRCAACNTESPHPIPWRAL